MRRILCHKCGRFLMEAHGTVVAKIVCSDTRCKATNEVKRIVLDDAHNLRAKMDSKPSYQDTLIETQSKQLKELKGYIKELEDITLNG